MTNKQIIIDDQKKTIHRLQDECTEKTNAIIALGNKLTAKEQECEELKETFDGLLKVQYKLADNCKKLRQTLLEIREIANSDNHYFSDGTILRYEVVNKILQKISEVE